MTILKGIIHNGQVVLSQPTDLPEGTEVQVVPTEPAGSADDERPMSSDEIARTLAAMDCVQPFEMTDLERAAIEADRRARKEWEKSRFFEHADRLRGMWE
jgi:hypothetical protein